MTALLEDRGRKADPFKMRIEGMDCGACATKIENALKHLPGLTDIQVSYDAVQEQQRRGRGQWRGRTRH